VTTLRLTDVTKTFSSGPADVEVLRGVDLALDGGDALAVTGPSGSGKSTLLHVVGTLERPTSGRVEVDGSDPFDLPERELARFRNRVVGFVFQDHHFRRRPSVPKRPLAGCSPGSASSDASAIGRPSSRAASASGLRWPGP
jgi:lipoprotein-releasing system ATP-binding protein